MSATTNLPFFVYGTLRPGYGNDQLYTDEALAVALADGECTVEGYRLVAHPRAYFPFAVPAPGERTVGALVVATFPATYDELIVRLDRLEGYPAFYDRVIVTVDTPTGPVKAWLYTPTRPEQYDDCPPVPGNDWANIPLDIDN